jgi:hypothetical protein
VVVVVVVVVIINNKCKGFERKRLLSNRDQFRASGAEENYVANIVPSGTRTVAPSWKLQPAPLDC